MDAALYEQQRRTYVELTEGELLALACDKESLTDSARGALAEELRPRGLGEKEVSEFRDQRQEPQSKWEWGRIARPKRWKRSTPGLLLFCTLGAGTLVYFCLGAAVPEWFSVHQREARLVSGLYTLVVAVTYAIVELAAIRRREHRRARLARALSAIFRRQQ